MIKVKLGKENGRWVGVVVDGSSEDRMKFKTKPSRTVVERALKRTLGISRALREEVDDLDD